MGKRFDYISILQHPYILSIGSLAVISSLLFPEISFAHEQWFLTPQQIADFNAKPKPTVFTELDKINVLIFSLTLLFMCGWILLGRTGARELFPNFRQRISSYSPSAALFLRITTAIMLFMAVFALNPRNGGVIFESPIFIFPDLELNSLPGNWLWMRWVELVIAIGLLFGIYVRFMAGLMLFCVFLSLYLFGDPMLAYTGFLTGVALYLLCQGGGIAYLHLPPLFGMKQLSNWLSGQGVMRAQYLLQVCAGLNFIYAGLCYKCFQPNLAVGLLIMGHMPTFGLSIETFVLLMAIVETLSGVLLLTGILIRPLSLLLLCCFIFLNIILGESLLAHTIFYGVLLACFINGAGRFRRVIAKDKPAAILILGASISGIHCAMKLERLLGEATNVRVMLVNPVNYFQFDPLLCEVIGGSVQPENTVNAIRRVCPRTDFIQGEVTAIHYQSQQVEVALISGDRRFIHFDQLIIAANKIIENTSIPGLSEHSFPIIQVSDALCIRQHILNCLEQADLTNNAQKRRKLLTFSVIGGGLRGCSVAAEMQELIKEALVSYPSLKYEEIKIYLFEKSKDILHTFDKRLAESVHKHLAKLNISVKTNVKIHKVTQQGIICSSGEHMACNTVVCALSKACFAEKPSKKNKTDGLINDKLQLHGNKNTFTTSIVDLTAACLPFQAWCEARTGKLAAYNAWANSQGLALRHWHCKQNYSFSIASLGRQASSVKIGGLIITGKFAWFISRVICALTLPGLERNLRVIMDWLFTIPFRQDIAAIAPHFIKQADQTSVEISDIKGYQIAKRNQMDLHKHTHYRKNAGIPLPSRKIVRH